ncbi:hypothetical protein [Psychroflexus halocasei]|uniref:Addiction module component n=1 Tax=Psychroflexus halocasei TaxID=908615 RepID=A0A1H4DBD9_9FLAO|nr:hypothetical protein [Psychroflexus halocasei]SEA70085.1 hypothetical protein SAMN05421540_11051 [Psychroflexus halocasei]
MDIQTRKIEFIQKFLKVESEDVINRLEKILRIENKTSEKEEFESMTIKEFNERIDKSMEDSKNGRLTKASDLKAKMEKWG